ncbi:MAG: hypothetical protein HY719_17740 [Planctomycetes bacterium]|nr:hypothetical protein [Planctomycetota bacterium]
MTQGHDHHPIRESGAVTELDRRQAPRAEAAFSFTYRIRKVRGFFSGKQEGRGRVRNESEGGFLFESDQPLGRGMVLEVIACDAPGALAVGGRVRILRDEVQNGVHVVAVEAER